MQLKVFCAWGEGAKDVGINIERTPDEIAAYPGGDLVPVDLTADEAVQIAVQLLIAAENARRLERECRDLEFR